MTEIESLPLGVTLGSVINRQPRDESVTDDCPRTRRPNAACADNPNSRHDGRTIQAHRRSRTVLIDRPGSEIENLRQPNPEQTFPPRVEPRRLGQ